jgi:cytochrome b
MNSRVRAGHWIFALALVVAWFTRHGGEAWHAWPGLVMVTLAVIRIALGFFGRDDPQFKNFVVGARDVATSTAARMRGSSLVGDYNPLSGYLIVAMLVLTLLSGLSGWLHASDRFWGQAWIRTIHSIFAHALVAAAGLHVLEVLLRRDRRDGP